MKAILFAATGYGNAVLERLHAEGYSVPVVFTAQPNLESDHFYASESLSVAAQALGARTFDDVDSMKSEAAFDAIKDAGPDLIVVVNGYDRTVSTHVAKLAKESLYLHPSLLPKYRGPSPSNWALIEGDAETGVTLARLHRMNDAGEILAQKTLAIEPSDTDASLRLRLGDAMASLLCEYLTASANGTVFIPRAQNEIHSTMYPLIARRDAHVRFDQGTNKIIDRVRGVTPFPGAYTDFCGVEFPITSIERFGPEAYNDEPGRVLELVPAKSELVVKSMDGSVRVCVDDELHRLGAIAERNRDILQFAGKLTPFSAKAIGEGAAYDTEMPDADEFTKYLEFPDMVVLAVAYPCNAHCPNCPYIEENSDIRKKYADANFIAPELFMKIADECGQAAREKWLPGGVGSFIRITGGGEPMMHPYGMTKLIEYAMGAGARVYLNTNGSLFSQDDIDRLLACNIDNIEVSVDCADETTYNIVRKGLDWNTTVGSLRKLIDQRNATRSKTTIEVSVINQEIVAGSIPEIEKFWYDFGVDNVIVRKFLTWGSSTNIDPNESADPFAYLDRDSGVPCPYPFHRLNVDSRGKVEVCGFVIMGRTNMGSIQESSIRDIWRGAMFNWWREKHQAGRGGDIPLCAECPDWKYRSWEHNYRKALKNAQERRDESFAKL